MASFRPSLKISILAFLSSLLLFAWCLFTLFAYQNTANDLYSQKGEHARLLLATFVSQLPDTMPLYPEALLPTDSPAIVFARKLAEDPMVVRLTLLDSNNKIVCTEGKAGTDRYLPFLTRAGQRESGGGLSNDGSTLSQIEEIRRNGALVGRAGLTLSLAAEQNRLKRSGILYLLYFIIDFILLVAIGSYILAKLVVQPVNRLLSATEKITAGHYGQSLSLSGSLELSRLAEAFTTMSVALQQKEQEVSTHLTALQRANDQLSVAREEAIRSEKMASIGLLAAGMAHEIGTPLSSIMGYVELLSGELGSPEVAQDYLRRISQDCRRIDGTVRGLLDYARPSGSAEATCDLLVSIREVVELLRQQGALKQLDVQITTGSVPIALAMADSRTLQQVLVNLLLNARDAMPSGGILSVGVSDVVIPAPAGDTVQHCWWRIDVSDTGCGILPEDRPKLFDPFFTTKSPGKGTGLGLAISARIIESFGGKITVDSTPGQGSCFSLWLRQPPAQQVT